MMTCSATLLLLIMVISMLVVVPSAWNRTTPAAAESFSFSNQLTWLALWRVESCLFTEFNLPNLIDKFVFYILIVFFVTVNDKSYQNKWDFLLLKMFLRGSIKTILLRICSRRGLQYRKAGPRCLHLYYIEWLASEATFHRLVSSRVNSYRIMGHQRPPE